MKWSIIWLTFIAGVLASFLALELYTVMDGKASTLPLTEVITQAPAWVVVPLTAGVGLALTAGITWHWWETYRNRRKGGPP